MLGNVTQDYNKLYLMVNKKNVERDVNVLFFSFFSRLNSNFMKILKIKVFCSFSIYIDKTVSLHDNTQRFKTTKHR